VPCSLVSMLPGQWPGLTFQADGAPILSLELLSMPSFAAPDSAVGVGEMFERSLSFAISTTLSLSRIKPWHLTLGGHVTYMDILGWGSDREGPQER
jgi:hypothetical protein